MSDLLSMEDAVARSLRSEADAISDSSEQETLQLAVYLASAVSLIGTCYVLLHFLWLRWFADKAHERSARKMDFTARLVFVLCLFDLVFIIARMVGRSVLHHATLCQMQAAVLQFSGFSSSIWIACMSFNLYRWIVGFENDATRESRFGIYVLVSILPSIALVAYHLREHKYGDSTFYCWLNDSQLVFLNYYLLYILVVVFNVILLILVQISISRRLVMDETVEADTSSMLIRRKLVMYIMIFIVHRAPIMIYRILEAVNIQSFELAVLVQVILDLDGFSNAIVYGGLCKRSFVSGTSGSRRPIPAESLSSPMDSQGEYLAKVRAIRDNEDDSILRTVISSTNMTRSSTMGTIPSTLLQMDEARSPSQYYYRTPFPDEVSRSNCSNESTTPKQGKKLSLFVSTFNMGEQNINEDELHEWIPIGHEVYVIGVQECMDLSDLQAKILHYLVAKSSRKYVHYSREIGKRATALGYHGYIALTVFVLQDAVLQGRFEIPRRMKVNKHAQELCRGKSLLVFGRASNKGAVGMSFRYENRSFAFVTCHLASDSTGNKLSSKRPNSNLPPSKIGRRNQDAMEILQQLHLDEVDYGFGFSLLHHHNFIFGDFNYRMSRQGVLPRNMLDLFTQVGSFTPSDNQLTHEKSPNYDAKTSQEEFAFQDFSTPKKCSRRASRSRLTLSSLIEQHDELDALRRAKQLFHGFEEPEIKFYPTFRRIRNHVLCPEDSQSFEDNYSLLTKKGGHRVPSYTDRVLYSSLPGVRESVSCTSYNSCEAVTTSDHKPITATFSVIVDNLSENASPPDQYVWTADSTGGSNPIVIRSEVSTPVMSGRMKDVPGACEMRLRMDFKSIHWVDDYSSNLFVQSEKVELGFLFPIPCEDVFAQQRKLHEVAESLTWGDNSVDFASTVTPSSNFHTIAWNQFVNTGLRYHTMAIPTGQRHVAVLLRAPTSASRARALSRTQSLSATMIGASNSQSVASPPLATTTTVPAVSTANQVLAHGTFCVTCNNRRQDISVSLTLGGKLVGRLQLRIGLQIKRF